MWEDVFYSVDDISYLMELMGKDGEIKHFPKLSEEDSKKYQLEFMKRYRFLYENSFFILGCFMNFYSLSGHILLGDNDELSELKKEVSKKIGISNHYYHLGESTEFIYLIEEAFFGGGPLEFMELYRIINAINSKTTMFPDLKIKFSKDDNLEFSERDKSFKVLLEVMKVFLNSQDNCYKYRLNDEIKSMKMWEYIQNKKKDLLNVYYDVFNYGLSNMGVLDKSLEFGFDFDFSLSPRSGSKVGSNPFLNAFSKEHLRFYNDKEMVTIPDDIKKELYYCYHDVLDWDYKEECREDEEIKRPSGTRACGTSFRIKEGDIFFYEDNFYHLCPECFYIVKLTKDNIPEVVGKRIINRCFEDKDILRRYSLLSELQYLEKEGKVLSKK